MNWESIRFGDLYAEDSRNGLTKPSKIRGSGYKMINMGELFANDRIFDIPMELVPLKESEKKNAKVEAGDLLFARQSLVLEGAGKCSIVMEVSPLTVFESHLIRIRLNRAVANPMFYYYYFKSPLSPVSSIVSQCAQAGIRGSDLQELTVAFPPLPVQNKMAEYLSKYDELIETNKKQIQLLEEAAQRLYKEWFVDLHFPGYEGVKVVDRIPEGWEIKTIESICNRVNAGGTPSRRKDGYWNPAEVIWYKTGELLDCWLVDSEEKISMDGLSNSSAKLFPKNTILMAIYASPTLGHLGILSSEACCNQASLCLLANEDIVSWQWLYHKLYELRDEFNAIAKGAGQQNISADTVKKKEIVVPTKTVMDRYTSIASPIFEKRLGLQVQNKMLAEARNRLLPKLMSGEIGL